MTPELKIKLEQKFNKNYVNALVFTMSAEGLFTNHAEDSGGMTYKGVSRIYNDRWEGWKIIDQYIINKYPELSLAYFRRPTSLSSLNSELNANEELNLLVYDFYFQKYYEKCGASLLSNKIGIVLFDISVLQGTKRAVKTIQRLANRYFDKKLLVDGIFGKNTLKGITEAIDEVGIDRFVAELLLEYQDNLVEASKYNKNQVFLQGWLNRIINLRNYLRLMS